MKVHPAFHRQNRYGLCRLQIHVVPFLQRPQNVAFRYGPYILSLPVNQRNCRIAAPLQLLDRLPKRPVVMQMGHFAFRRQKK